MTDIVFDAEGYKYTYENGVLVAKNYPLEFTIDKSQIGGDGIFSYLEYVPDQHPFFVLWGDGSKYLAIGSDDYAESSHTYSPLTGDITIKSNGGFKFIQDASKGYNNHCLKSFLVSPKISNIKITDHPLLTALDLSYALRLEQLWLIGCTNLDNITWGDCNLLMDINLTQVPLTNDQWIVLLTALINAGNNSGSITLDEGFGVTLTGDAATLADTLKNVLGWTFLNIAF